jgi:hypothetical protein
VAALPVLLLLAHAAGALGTIRTELDRETAVVGEPFTLTFLLPADCPWARVALPPSDRYEVVSTDFGSEKRLAKVTLTEGSSGRAPKMQRSLARSAGRVVVTLKALKPGSVAFEPVDVACGEGKTRTLRRELVALPAPAAKAPAAEGNPEGDILGKTAALQNLGSAPPSESQILAKELAALKPSAGAADTADQEMPDEKPRGWGSYLVAWNRRVQAAGRVWSLKAFGISEAAAPYVVGGLFVAGAVAAILADWWARWRKKRRAQAALPQVVVRRPPPPPQDKT